MLQLAAEHGWKVGPDSNWNCPWLVIDPCVRRVGWNEGSAGFPWISISISAAIELLKKDPPPPPILIDGNTVEFRPDGSIKVGCVAVSIDTINAIHKRFHQNDKAPVKVVVEEDDDDEDGDCFDD